jgi:hypothetical protein
MSSEALSATPTPAPALNPFPSPPAPTVTSKSEVKNSTTLDKIKQVAGVILTILGALFMLAAILGTIGLVQATLAPLSTPCCPLFMPGLISLLSGLNLMGGTQGPATISSSFGGVKVSIGSRGQ